MMTDEQWAEIRRMFEEFQRMWDLDPDTYDNPEQHRAAPMEEPK